MLQLENVTVPLLMNTPAPCKPRRVLACGQFEERASIGALEGEEPFNRCTILTHCAGESRGARRCQFNDSIGALEGAGAVQQMANTHDLCRRESRREAMSVQRFQRGIGASKWGKCTHVGRLVVVDVTVGERDCGRSCDEDSSSLPLNSDVS